MSKPPVLTVECWENERYYPFGGWSKTLLPGDPEAWTDKDSKETSKIALSTATRGYEWHTDWKIEIVAQKTDKHGWTYGGSFGDVNKTSADTFDVVRMRRWIRHQKLKITTSQFLQKQDQKQVLDAQQQQRKNLFGDHNNNNNNSNNNNNNSNSNNASSKRDRSRQRVRKNNSKGKSRSGRETAQVDDFLSDVHTGNTNALANAIRYANEANEHADISNESLSRQHEQMININSDLYAMNDTMHKSERVIKGMSSWTGRVGNAVTSDAVARSEFNDRVTDTMENAPPRRQRKNRSNRKNNAYNNNSINSNSNSNSRQTADPSSSRTPTDIMVNPASLRSVEQRQVSQAQLQYEANERLEDQQLDQLSVIMSQLHDKSLDMNAQLKLQDAELNKMDAAMTLTSDRMQKNTANIKNLM